VLSRKRNEAVYIDGKRIIVTVVDVRGDKVRLGFTADKETSVHRAEVFEAIERDVLAAQQASEPPTKET